MRLKNTVRGILICVGTFSIGTISCTTGLEQTSTSTEANSNIGITAQGEEYLAVTAPAGWNTFKTTEPITLMIINVSDNQIVSNDSFNSRIFILSEDKWVEVNNKVVYANNPFTLESNKEMDPTKIFALFVSPELPDDQQSYEVRIFVFGSMINEDKTEVEIVDYVDVQLFP